MPQGKPIKKTEAAKPTAKKQDSVKQDPKKSAASTTKKK